MSSKKLSFPAYKLLDSGNCRKLEQVGRFRVIRPALNAFWEPSLPESEWKRADALFERDSEGAGHWRWFRGSPPDISEEWAVSWGGVNLSIKPTQFGHLGFFAEQAANWEWLRNRVSQIQEKTGNQARTLNLFAYSGGATLAMAQAGAECCHLDSSKGIIEWAKKNQLLNPETNNKVRWICDDAMKFVAREQRRGSKYNGIVLDPPSFGRGTQGQVWKIEEGIAEMLQTCIGILDTQKPFFVLLSCHSQGFSPVSLNRSLAQALSDKKIICETGEMVIPEENGNMLPAGLYARVSSGMR